MVWQVYGSPLGQIAVRPAPSEAVHSRLVPPNDAIVTNEPASFFVLCRDEHGNAATPADLAHALAAGDVAARIDGGPCRPTCKLLPHADGSVQIEVHAPLSGQYRLSVWVGGSPLPPPACPYLFSVEPRPFNRSAGFASKDGLVTPRSASPTSPRSRSPTSIEHRSPRLNESPTRAHTRYAAATKLSPRTLHRDATTPQSLGLNSSLGSSPARLPPSPGRDSLMSPAGRRRTGGGYMPTSPSNSTSPGAWHGQRKAYNLSPKAAVVCDWHTGQPARREPKSHAAAAGSPTARDGTISAVASPRTPPRTAGHVKTFVKTQPSTAAGRTEDRTMTSLRRSLESAFVATDWDLLATDPQTGARTTYVVPGRYWGLASM
jgi:hypothetical protein